MKRSLLESLISVLLVTVPGLGVSLAPDAAEAAPPTDEQGLINGVVKHANDNKPIENAIVLLQCSCIDGQQARMTNSRGVYSFLKYPLLYKYSKQLAFKKYNLPSRLKQNLPNGLKKFFRKDLMELVLKHTKTNATYPKITEDDRSFLKIHYYDDVKKLKQITGLKFNEWTDFKNQL